MRPLEEIYRENFFSRRNKLNWRYSVICNAIKEVFGNGIDSIIDVGCATGGLIRELAIRGYNVEGIEGSINAKKYFQYNHIKIYDMRRQIIDTSLHKMFDLVLSIEVAEHIEEEFSDIFISNLIYFAKDIILITAAKPNQKGHYHVNCQSAIYWIEKFKKNGFNYCSDLAFNFKNFFEPWRRKKGLSFFCENTLIFRKGY